MTQRPDPTTARDTGGGFEPHSEGQFGMIWVDVVNRGTSVEQFPGNDPREVDKVALVFASGETQGAENELTLVTVEMTNSMNEKANLRKFLEYKKTQYADALARHRKETRRPVDDGIPIGDEPGDEDDDLPF